MDTSLIIGNISRERFRISANKLLNECFLLKRHTDTMADYNFILNNRQVFSDYFELLGYEIIVQEEQGVICLNNVFGSGRIRLSKLESILLLILRLLYVEKRRSLNQLEEVIITADEIFDKYNMLKMNSRIDRVSMRSAMGRFKRMHLVSNLDADMSAYETRIKIHASVLFAMPAGSIEEVYKASKERLEKYQNGGESDDGDSEETDEN